MEKKAECEMGGGLIEDRPPSPTCTEEGSEDPGETEKSDRPQIPSQLWNDWRWQMRNRLRSVGDLPAGFRAESSLKGLADAAAKSPLAVTPYYASLIRENNYTDPIFKMCVPDPRELIDPACLKDDPLEEDEDMPVPGLVHRYPDRALLIATATCSCYCRHCTRKRVAGHRETHISATRLNQVVEYLKGHPEIHDVILSGGDPLTMDDAVLERVVAVLRSVESVDIIRIGTRTPVVLPMRITDSLVQMLRKYHPLYVNTQFNHPNELTSQAGQACRRLADAGIPVGNQTVLLRGVNDNPEVLEGLFRGLVRVRVRPYYLFQCDLVRGVEHFRTPLARGIEIMEYLRGRLSGLAIPTFVVDAPHGGGKIPLLPNYIVSVSPTHTVLRNYEGYLVSYPEPNTSLGAEVMPKTESAPGVWELASGEYTRIVPAQTVRGWRRLTHKRRSVGSERLRP